MANLFAMRSFKTVRMNVVCDRDWHKMIWSDWPMFHSEYKTDWSLSTRIALSLLFFIYNKPNNPSSTPNSSIHLTPFFSFFSPLILLHGSMIIFVEREWKCTLRSSPRPSSVSLSQRRPSTFIHHNNNNNNNNNGCECSKTLLLI